jgi:nitrate reductase assembly molybdenum cofactor insertion protein NarJ
MTKVIGRRQRLTYRRGMLAGDDLQQLAIVLDRPTADYLAHVERAQSAALAQSLEAARQLEVFVARIQDLSPAELVELYDETFNDEFTTRDVLAGLATIPLTNDGIVSLLKGLTVLLERLESRRNPFAVPVRALCLLLAKRSETDRRDLTPAAARV